MFAERVPILVPFCIQRKDMMSKKEKYISPDDRMSEIIKDFQTLGYRQGISTAFTDYITLASCAISNSVDKLHYDEREKLYCKTIKKYAEEDQKLIKEIHHKIIGVMGECLYQKDVLGELFHKLNLSNSWNGQFFTPFHIAELMALMTVGNLSDEMNGKGYATICEPTCGSGVMVIAAANAVYRANLNPSKNICVLAVDNDIRCAMMAYIQLSYLGIPAVVIHGDSLQVKEYTRFYTPVYMIGDWLWREPMSLTDHICDDDIKLRSMGNPLLNLIEKCKDSSTELITETRGEMEDV